MDRRMQSVPGDLQEIEDAVQYRAILQGYPCGRRGEARQCHLPPRRVQHDSEATLIRRRTWISWHELGPPGLPPGGYACHNARGAHARAHARLAYKHSPRFLVMVNCNFVIVN